MSQWLVYCTRVVSAVCWFPLETDTIQHETHRKWDVCEITLEVKEVLTVLTQFGRALPDHTASQGQCSEMAEIEGARVLPPFCCPRHASASNSLFFSICTFL